MKGKKLKAITLLLVGAVGAGVVGCSSGKAKSAHVPNIPSLEEFKAVENIDLKFFHAMGASNQTLIKGYIDSFKVLYPNVTIVQSSIGDYAALEKRVNSELSIGGNGVPDIIQAYPDHLANYMEGDWVLNLEKYIGHSNAEIGLKGESEDGKNNFAKNDIVEAYLNELNKLPLAGSYGLPFNKSTEVMVYNETVLKEVGFTNIPASDKWTWDDVVEASQKIRDFSVGGVKKYGGNDYLPFAYDSAANLFITIGQQWGGEYTSQDGLDPVDHIRFDKDAKFKAGIEFYKEQVTKGYFNLPTYFENASYASDLFKAQKVFMSVGSSAGINYNLPTDLNDFQVRIAAIPQKAGAKTSDKQVIQQGTNISLLWKETSDNKMDEARRLASWLFIRHMTNTQNTIEWATSTGYFPVRKSALNDASYVEFMNKTDYTKTATYVADVHKIAKLQSEYMYYSPAFPGSSNIRAACEEGMKAIVAGTSSIDKAMTDIRSTIQSL